MSETPSTIETGTAADAIPATGPVASVFGWEDSAELHKCEDGGGLFHRFKTIRRGTVAELIRFVMGMNEDRQDDYAIHKDGDHTFRIGEIRTLSRRADFPKA